MSDTGIPEREPPLTDREQEVLSYIDQGLTGVDIAEKMGVRLGTVKVHIKHAADKVPPQGKLRGYRKLLRWLGRVA